MNKTLIIFGQIILAIVLAVGALFLYKAVVPAEVDGDVDNQPSLATVALEFASTTVVAEIADTPHAHQQGLSRRDELAEGAGMLFVFSTPDRYGFWMKDMRFAIDILWLAESSDGTLTVADITHALSPDTYPQTFSPSIPVRFVLEVPSGFAEKNDISIGSTVGYTG